MSHLAHFVAEHTLDPVAHGFPAGFAEMYSHPVGGLANRFYQVWGSGGVRGGCGVAALRYRQGDGVTLSAGAVGPLRGGGGAGNRHAGIVGHNVSFHRCQS